MVNFLTHHLGYQVPSPAVFEKIGIRFRAQVRRFAAERGVPVVHFARGERKLEVMRPLLGQAAATGRPGVAAVGVAQEFQRVYTGTKCCGEGDQPAGELPRFRFSKNDRRTTCYYFYLWDAEFGPAFITMCAYFPYPVKIWVNGHEWAKRQATKAGIGFTELSKGFATSGYPTRLQAICDSLGPDQIRAFADRWLQELPTPFTDADRQAGYWWDLSMRQVEVSRTMVFTAPRYARSFFETLIADNLDIGRPDHVEIIFGRKTNRDTTSTFHTAIDRYTDGVVINATFKHSRIKQYLERRPRPADRDRGQQSQRPRDAASPGASDPTARTRPVTPTNDSWILCGSVRAVCLPTQPFQRVAHPTIVAGRRAPALRLGDPRVMALTGALCTSQFAVTASPTAAYAPMLPDCSAPTTPAPT